MSIYATVFDLDDDDHAEECQRWVPIPPGKEWQPAARLMSCTDGRRWSYDSTKPCTCRCGPLAYQGSHVLPADDDRRDGAFSLALIPGFITRPGCPPIEPDQLDDHPAHPWLRVSLNGEDVVLTRAHVVALRGCLNDWLDGATSEPPA